MDWSPLGGNPVVGAPDTIRKVGAGECQRVSDMAREGQTELKRIFAGLDDSIWNDASARKLEQKTPDVLEDLRKLRDSYGDVATALFTYAVEVETAQSMAKRANERLRAAQRTERELVERRGALDHRAGVLDGERRAVEAEISRLEADQRHLGVKRYRLLQDKAAATDPVVVDSLQRQLSSVTTSLAAIGQHLGAARPRLPAIDQQRVEVDQEIRSVERTVADAHAEQGKARQLAAAAVTVRDSAARRAEADVRAAAGRAVGTPIDKLKYEVRTSQPFNLALESVDLFAEGLASAIAVCDLLAMVPGLNAVFGPVTVVLRGIAVGVALISIAGHVAKAAAGGEALDGAWFLARGLSVVTVVAGVRAVSKASAVSKPDLLIEKKRVIQGQTKVITNATSEAKRAAIRQFDATEVVKRRVLAHAGQVRRAEGLPFAHPTGTFDTVRSLADATHGRVRHLVALTEGSRLGLVTDAAMQVDRVVSGAEGAFDLRDRFAAPPSESRSVTGGDVAHDGVTAAWDLLQDHYRAVK